PPTCSTLFPYTTLCRSLSQAHKLDRDPKLFLNLEDDTAFGCTIELRQEHTCDIHYFAEYTRLHQAILPDGGIDDQQDLIHRGLRFHDALALAWLFHQRISRMETTGGTGHNPIA